MRPALRAITFDLDDTLWAFEPVLAHIETTLDDWLRTHAPAVALAFPPQAMRALRNEIALKHPQHRHRMSILRKLTLGEAFTRAGEGPDLLAQAYEVFLTARCNVTLFEDVLPALKKLKPHYKLAAISNGNANLHRIGIAHWFDIILHAETIDIAKPDPRIFALASQQLNLPPHQILHIGDHPIDDILGAQGAGYHAAWMNRHNLNWAPETSPQTPPPLSFSNLHGLIDWLGH